MKLTHSLIAVLAFNFLFIHSLFAQKSEEEELTVRATLAGGVVYMLNCENGFGGGNVAASVGPDGILLVDDMYKTTMPKVFEALKNISDKSVRIVVNTHYHRDHIEGNAVLSGSSTLIAHENVLKRLKAKSSWASTEAFPLITYTDRLSINFNGEEIQVFHLPTGHTDGDSFVYFTKSKVIHLGDTYFNGMFPAVYKSGGGDLTQLIRNMEKIFAETPDDVVVIPGHGSLATKKEFESYIILLKETTAIVTNAIREGKSLEQLKKIDPFSKYSSLGNGGAQTTDEYLTMLYKLLSE